MVTRGARAGGEVVAEVGHHDLVVPRGHLGVADRAVGVSSPRLSRVRNGASRMACWAHDGQSATRWSGLDGSPTTVVPWLDGDGETDEVVDVGRPAEELDEVARHHPAAGWPITIETRWGGAGRVGHLRDELLQLLSGQQQRRCRRCRGCRNVEREHARPEPSSTIADERSSSRLLQVAEGAVHDHDRLGPLAVGVSQDQSFAPVGSPKGLVGSGTPSAVRRGGEPWTASSRTDRAPRTRRMTGQRGRVTAVTPSASQRRTQSSQR